MKTAILVVILILLVILFCFISALCGFFAGKKVNVPHKPKKSAEMKKEEIRKAKQAEKEIENMLSYNGDEQEDITVL